MRIIPDVVSEQRLASLPPSDTAQSAARLMLERDVSAVLVIENGTLAGIVTERDMTRAIAAHNRDASTVLLGEIMTRAPVVLRPDDDARDALELMEIQKFRHLPIVSDGHVVGIVSIRDLYAAVKRQIVRVAELSQRYILGDRYHVD